jgi:hypothetical protein
LSCRALLAERLHGGDAFAAHGPHPGHRHVEVALRQPAAADEPSEHQNPVAVILEVLWQRLDAAIGDPDPLETIGALPDRRPRLSALRGSAAPETR